MKKFLLIASVVLAAFALSCTKETKVEDGITVKTNDASVPVEGGVVSIEINSTVAWTAKSNQSWVTISPASGEAGDATVKASVMKNDETDARTAEITFTAGSKTAKFNITQGQKNDLQLETTSFEVPAEGGTVAVKVKANVTYSVLIPDAVDWVTQTKGLTESTETLNVAASYEEETRTANITITDGTLSSTVTIAQGAFEPYYDMELPEGVGQFSGFGDGNPLVLGPDETSFTINVSSNMSQYCYFAPWDAELGEAVETNDVGWIKFEYDDEKIVFTLEPNTGYVPREEYFYSGCFVGDHDFPAYGSCILIRQDGLVPEAGASVMWTKLLSEIGIPSAIYHRLAYKTDGGDALLVSDGSVIHVLNPANGEYWKTIEWTTVIPTSICSDDAGHIIAAPDYPFEPGSEYVIYYTDNVNNEPMPLIVHTADFNGTIGSIRVRGDISKRAVVTAFISENRYWAGWEIDNYTISLDNYYATGTGGQARGPIAVDGDAWTPEAGAVMSLGPTLAGGIAYRAYDTDQRLYYLADAYTPNWVTPYAWQVISEAGAGGNECQNNMDIIDYEGRRIMAYTQGLYWGYGGNASVYVLDVTNPNATEVIAILDGEELASVDSYAVGEDYGWATLNAYVSADVKLHVEEGVGLVCYVVNSTLESLSKLLITF